MIKRWHHNRKAKKRRALISTNPVSQTIKATSYGTNSEDHDQSSAEKGYSTELKELLERISSTMETYRTDIGFVPVCLWSILSRGVVNFIVAPLDAWAYKLQI